MTPLTLSISVLVAFGAISVAANSLLSAMSVKLHEATQHGSVYLFLYKSDKAENLRRALGKNPRYLLRLYLFVAPFVLGSGALTVFDVIEGPEFTVALQATVVCVFVTLVVWRATVQHRKACDVLRDLSGLRINSSQPPPPRRPAVRRWFSSMAAKLTKL